MGSLRVKWCHAAGMVEEVTNITRNRHNVTLQYVAYLIYFPLVALLSLLSISFLTIFKTFYPITAPGFGKK
jgi:hypothetical protein